MVAHRFEAREGWVPANTDGSVWCYRAGGNVGVLAFRHGEAGECLYEATHQDCYASDETIITAHRVDAVRFAVAGAKAAAKTGGEAAAPPPASSDTPTEAGAQVELPVAPWREPASERDALRAAWHHSMLAASELLQHVKAGLDAAAHAEVLGRFDRAIALVRADALATPAVRAEVDIASVAIEAAVRRAHELISGAEAGERAEL